MKSNDGGLTAIDLFAGAGGMSAGFVEAGFSVLFANDFEAPAVETYRLNHPNVQSSCGDVREIDADSLRKKLGLKKGQLHVVFGGPPCQGFSTYGQRSATDLRNQLYKEFFRFVDAFRPKTFVMENVMGILSMCGGKIIEDVQKTAKSLGYGSDVFILDAADYGVPQHRRRVFIIGGDCGKQIKGPRPSYGDSVASPQSELFGELQLKSYVTVKDAIADLPETVLPPNKTQQSFDYLKTSRMTEYQKLMRKKSNQIFHHSAKRMLGIRRLRLALLQPGDYGADFHHRFNQTQLTRDEILALLESQDSARSIDKCRIVDRKKEQAIRKMLQDPTCSIEQLKEHILSGGFANKYRRLHWDKPSHTLVAHMARDCSDFVHPQYNRFISVREAARLQSFPDRFLFSGSQFRQLRQVGNAVPPLLAEAVAKSVSRA